MFRRRWFIFALAGLILFGIFSNIRGAREEQRAYQEGYIAGQMAALAAQNNNGAGTVPPGMNPYGGYGYNQGWGYRGGGPHFFPGFLFLPLLLIGGFMAARFWRHRMWAQHAGWYHDGPEGQGFGGRGPWGSPENLRRHAPWGPGGPRGFRGGPGGDRFGGGYWWREGDTAPNAPESPVAPAPQAPASDATTPNNTSAVNPTDTTGNEDA